VIKTNKKLLSALTLIFMTLSIVSFSEIVHASPQNNLKLSYVYCPSKVYIGEPFAAQVNITNLDSKPHNYTLTWSVRWFLDRGYDLRSSDVIGSKDEIAITEPFTFLEITQYFIKVELFEENNQTPVNSTEWTVDVVALGFTFRHWIDTYPIYPGQPFNVDITVQNVGNTEAYEVTLRLTPPRERKLKLLSLPSYELGNLKTGESNSTQLRFNSTEDIPPGVYLISCNLEYFDDRNAGYRQTYDIYIEISSKEAREEMQYLDHMVEILRASNESLKSEMQRQWLNTLYISAVLLAIIILATILNYHFAQKLKHQKIQR